MRGQIIDAVSITERPPSVENRAVPGHWEGDLLAGAEALAHRHARRASVAPRMAHHHRFTVDTNVAVYFCDPQSPWQRGTNENTNGLLRQYFPTGTDLSTVTQAQLNAIARCLNTRPRKT